MAFPHDLSAFMAVILILGASRVLLSLVYLDERLLTVAQQPYTVPTKPPLVKRHEVERRVAAQSDQSGEDSGHAFKDLLQKFKGDEGVALPPKETDMELEIDVDKSAEVPNHFAEAKISEFKTRLSRLKSTKLHDELKFWTAGSGKACPNFGQDLYLLSIVNTEPLREKQRDAIRATWGALRSADGRNIKTVFVVGHQTSKGTAESLRKRIQEEDARYGDVIGADIIEPKRLTTASTMRFLAAFKWVLLNCPLVKYVFIGPDNLFVDHVNMVKYLKHLKDPKNLYLGRVRKDGKPQRDRDMKDFVDFEVYKPESYPKYCVGGAGFVVSSNFLLNAYLKSVVMATKAKGFYLGDVYLGMIALHLKVWPKYEHAFLKLGGDADYCDLRETITLGGFGSESLMKSVWKNHSMVVPHCHNPIPNATEIEEWTGKTNNKPYFDNVLKLLHNPKKTCWKNPETSRAPYLLGLVSSMPEHFELRAAIRQTWAAPDYMEQTNSKTLFILGKSRGMSVATQRAVDEEAHLNRDIIQGNFLESFHNLTLKVILGLRWVSNNCKKAAFIYKGDDDMLVNFEQITEHLRSLPSNQSERLFLGHMMGLSPVVREKSKYQVIRSQYPFRYFLPYFSGGGYIMSAAAVRDMNKMTLTTKLIPIDDAYAGILAFRPEKPIDLSDASSTKFITTGSRKDACYLRNAFNIHGFKKTSVMKETWRDFRDPDKQCEEPKQRKSGRKHI
ncbi:uncharacterized protein LOC119720085 [Patiria miniata]|uniref:Hexosyltransferase n=1 Tax=Patiria miniata TaxID=46514 RepID=A0A913Z3F4_PATMI|nr:uncharacterized protein LOC119720085 [Patiria miniata]XP_038045541.1 uncharacterized protein LOC119720085 [Patiria miniata]